MLWALVSTGTKGPDALDVTVNRYQGASALDVSVNRYWHTKCISLW